MSFKFYLYHIKNNIGDNFKIISAMDKHTLQVYINEEDKMFSDRDHDYIVGKSQRVNLTKDNVRRTIYIQFPLNYTNTNENILTKEIYDEYLYLEQFCLDNNIGNKSVTIPKDYGDFLDCKVITDIIE